MSEQAECTTVLYCIGQKVDWRELLTGTAVEFNPNGTVKADPVTYQTAEKDIFVGDEVRVRCHPPAPRETGVQQDVRL